MRNTLKTATLAGFVGLAGVSFSANAFWGGGPGYGGWGDDFFGDGWGDFNMSMSGHGSGYGRGYGYGHRYPYWGGPYGYPGYGGYGGPWGGPGYGGYPGAWGGAPYGGAPQGYGQPSAPSGSSEQ